jgi:hypothetical protein
MERIIDSFVDIRILDSFDSFMDLRSRNSVTDIRRRNSLIAVELLVSVSVGISLSGMVGNCGLGALVGFGAGVVVSAVGPSLRCVLSDGYSCCPQTKEVAALAAFRCLVITGGGAVGGAVEGVAIGVLAVAMMSSALCVAVCLSINNLNFRLLSEQESMGSSPIGDLEESLELQPLEPRNISSDCIQKERFLEILKQIKLSTEELEIQDPITLSNVVLPVVVVVVVAKKNARLYKIDSIEEYIVRSTSQIKDVVTRDPIEGIYKLVFPPTGILNPPEQQGIYPYSTKEALLKALENISEEFKIRDPITGENVVSPVVVVANGNAMIYGKNFIINHVKNMVNLQKEMKDIVSGKCIEGIYILRV